MDEGNKGDEMTTRRKDGVEKRTGMAKRGNEKGGGKGAKTETRKHRNQKKSKETDATGPSRSVSTMPRNNGPGPDRRQRQIHDSNMNCYYQSFIYDSTPENKIITTVVCLLQYETYKHATAY